MIIPITHGRHGYKGNGSATNRPLCEIVGLSTDTKPTAADGYDVPHGSTWLCLDTADVWFYNKNNDTWYLP